MIDVATFGWPQWLLLAWIALAMILSARKHGERVEIRAHFNIVIWLITLVVLVFGGFFSR